MKKGAVHHGRGAWWRTAAAALLAAASVQANGCRQIVGIGETDPPLTCDECMGKHCSGELGACATDDVCSTRTQCVARCASDDDACKWDCSALGQTLGTPADDALTTCRASKCTQSCGLKCGGVLATHFGEYVTQSTSCRNCLSGSYCGAAATCASIPSCTRAMSCGVRCPQYDITCRNHCYEGLDVATVEIYKNLRVLRNDCSGDCGNGSLWGCLQTRRWDRKPDGAPITVTVEIDDYAAGEKNNTLPLVDAWPCVLGESCPRSPRPTDESGLVTLTLPAAAVTGFTGFITLEKPGYVPAYWKWQPPPVYSMSEPRAYAMVPTEAFAWVLESLHKPGTPIVDVDPELGMIALEMVDCLGNVARGVRYEYPRGDRTTSAYFDKLTPLLNATNTSVGNLHAAYNVPLGTLDVDVFEDTINERVGRGTLTVARGVLSGIQLVPLSAK
jgi:hypothetical protein